MTTLRLLWDLLTGRLAKRVSELERLVDSLTWEHRRLMAGHSRLHEYATTKLQTMGRETRDLKASVMSLAMKRVAEHEETTILRAFGDGDDEETVVLRADKETGR